MDTSYYNQSDGQSVTRPELVMTGWIPLTSKQSEYNADMVKKLADEIGRSDSELVHYILNENE